MEGRDGRGAFTIPTLSRHTFEDVVREAESAYLVREVDRKILQVLLEVS